MEKNKTLLYNYHTHTIFCDGKNTPEEMVEKAIELGLSSIGFSGHSYTDFSDEWCMSPDGTKQYKNEINRLKEKYKNKIEILLGVEQEYFSKEPTDDYEYVIGAVHYVLKNVKYLSVDDSRQTQIDIVNNFYGGDFYAFVEDYYALVGDVYNKTKCDIIGHFDLITKFNAYGSLFDTNNPRYIAAWKSAADKLIATPAVFEVNTGGIARGYTKTPYPEKSIIDYLKKNGVRLIYSSDCHDKNYLLFEYDKVMELIGD